MTDERKNEIWAFLTLEEKTKYGKEYLSSAEDDWDRGYEAALRSIFGHHNLTAQAGEKPKVVVAENATTIDYQQYRLDLAKEIAVQMLKKRSDMTIAQLSVNLANEIVKRLKETEDV